MKQIVLTIALAALVSLRTAYAQPTLEFAVDLIRHGDRTPVYQLPSTPYFEQSDLGQLLTRGVEREHHLGEIFHNRYIVQHHLLPEQLDLNTLYVRSTNKDRTIASAEAALEGLYPKAFKQIPIEILPQKIDPMIHTHEQPDLFSKLHIAYMHYYTWQHLDPKLTQHFPEWSQISGIPLNNFHHLNQFADNLYVRDHNHLPLPKGISHRDVQQITHTMDALYCQYHQLNSVSYPMGHAFLKQIYQQFVQHLDGSQPKLKWAFYSAHDTSIMSVIATLKAPLNEVPDYGSDLNFSLYQDHHQPIIHVRLNNRPVNIPKCNYSHKCSLEQFKQLTL